MNRLLLQAARQHANRTAIVEAPHHQHPHKLSYADLMRKSSVVKSHLERLGVRKGDRVCLFGEKTADYAAIQWGIWRLGGVSLTLLPSYPANELVYYMKDSEARVLIATDSQKAQGVISHLDPSVSKNVHVTTPKALVASSSGGINESEDDVDITNDDIASLIYTSGSTSQPKGVVTTHGALTAMVKGMVQAWEWTENDHILHFLPLHHIHGAVNKLLTPLCVGAKVEFVDFEAEQILKRLNSSNDAERSTVFMGVPTIYAKLVERWERDGRPELKNLAKLRLLVSGSAPLPVHLFEKFHRIAGQPILERWGMTEVGMGLSNPLRPIEKRHAGYVGLPMPGIHVKLVDLDADAEGKIGIEANHPGDLLVRGDSVFQTYWGRAAKLTDAEFTADGYFKTGDVAVFDSELESYKIVGRKSVDVIKSGGYKISALEIERVLLECHDIEEVAVLGVPDQIWGEVVAAIVVPKPQTSVQINEQLVKDFAAKHLVKYKIPRQILVMSSIPKNAMGKVNKKSLKLLFAAQQPQG